MLRQGATEFSKKKKTQQQHKQDEKPLQIDLFVQSLAQLAEAVGLSLGRTQEECTCVCVHTHNLLLFL